jgi:hypothetical protein
LIEAFRRLPTNTHTFIGLSVIILHHDIDRVWPDRMFAPMRSPEI